MNILLLRGFNNYFNRVVKKYSTLADYKDNSASYLNLANINFNPNDGIATELIIGSTDQTENNAPLKWDEIGTPDYLVAYDNGDGENVNVSRWFVLESERTRTGQYRIALKRDVLADHFEDILNAPCFVEKGIINDITNPLILNPEGSVVNQIKQNETLIKDDSQCSWLVGYIKKDLNQKVVSGTPSSAIDDEQLIDDIDFLDCIVFKDANGSIVQNKTKTAVYQTGGSKIVTEIVYQHAHTGSANTRYGIEASADASTPTWTSAGDKTASSYYGLTNGAFYNTNYWLPANVIGDDPTRITNASNSNSVVIAGFNALKNSLKSSTLSINNLRSEPSTLASYNGKYILRNNVLYKVTITLNSNVSTYFQSYAFSDDANISAFVNAVTNQIGNISTNSTSAQVMSYLLACRVYDIIATEAVVPGTLSVTIPAHSDRNGINNELFDMFIMPYLPDWDNGVINYGGATINSEDSMFIAQNIMQDLQVQTSGAEAYDLQLLPYCPMDLPFGYDLAGLTETKDYVWVKDTDNNKRTIIFFPTTASFTKNIPLAKTLGGTKTKQFKYEGQHRMYWKDDEQYWLLESNQPIIVPVTDENAISNMQVWANHNLTQVLSWELEELSGLDNYGALYLTLIWPNEPQEEETVDLDLTFNYNTTSEITPLELKVKNETEFMRLTSPNFNSLFEFKLTKFSPIVGPNNYGGFYEINVDCTYKPFNPYIKLNPDFSGVYGTDWNDATGLILSGDFSLSILSDPWKQYELNNKNYQAIFNRQVQNLDISQEIARDQQQFKALTGVLTGTIGGAMAGGKMGAKTGNPYIAAGGAAAGALAGVALAGINAAKNEEWLAKQLQETKSYTIDMYNYQLGNIQALPQTITKSSPLTYNNKIWPILEEFGCTEQEKQVIENKIRYNSMNIMAIGTLNEYMTSSEIDKVYVKGQLIRLETINDDFHVVDAIYQEVNKGFFVIQGE